MSNSDSFIDEVNEEVRRDRLFTMIRRYGWIAVAAVVLLVGAAAWREWSIAQEAARAQAFGDSLNAALENNDAAARSEALAAIEPANPSQEAVIAMYEADAGPGETPAPDVAKLEQLAAQENLPQVYRDLAALKAVMAAGDTLEPDAKIQRLEPLTTPGAPYRLLALEQTALAELAKGEKDAALARLKGILAEDQVSEGLRRRASQLIVALGGTLDAT
ncbi:hypothetical protein [Oceaniglobus roseus]|uniref:hypothetical protein n=1 Tax=Oceaniglobus roseus TaxID=1737570 RepID=UPI000C7E903C|nr:hypothetical protein [Kandeliimicrobium roseum]